MKPFDLLRPARGAPTPTPVTAPAGDLGGFSPDALLALGADGRVLQANGAAIELFNKPLEKLQGEKLEKLLDEPAEVTRRRRDRRWRRRTTVGAQQVEWLHPVRRRAPGSGSAGIGQPPDPGR